MCKVGTDPYLSHTQKIRLPAGGGIIKSDAFLLILSRVLFHTFKDLIIHIFPVVLKLDDFSEAFRSFKSY